MPWASSPGLGNWGGIAIRTHRLILSRTEVPLRGRDLRLAREMQLPPEIVEKRTIHALLPKEGPNFRCRRTDSSWTMGIGECSGGVPVNQSPQVEAGTIQEVNGGDTLFLDGSDSFNSEGGALTFN